jgi:MSHA biogenesis protein MshJ
MKAAWKHWSARIDALSLRERVFLFASVAVALVALTDTLVLTPRATEQKALTARVRAQAEDLAALRLQFSASNTGAQSPGATLLRELHAVEAERAQVDDEIRRSMAGGSASDRLAALFERVLRRHERLTLVRFASGDSEPGTPGAPPMHTVEIGLSGGYLDLCAYVADLEHSLPGMRWDELTVVRQAGAAELRARLAFPGETP